MGLEELISLIIVREGGGGFHFYHVSNSSVPTSIGYLTSSGMSAASFSTPSDYRIKENVKTLDTSFNIDLLRPVQYANKLTKKKEIGLIAHELQEHYPFLVTGVKDGEETQTVNYIGLIGILIKEIQSLKESVVEKPPPMRVGYSVSTSNCISIIAFDSNNGVVNPLSLSIGPGVWSISYSLGLTRRPFNKRTGTEDSEEVIFDGHISWGISEAIDKFSQKNNSYYNMTLSTNSYPIFSNTYIMTYVNPGSVHLNCLLNNDNITSIFIQNTSIIATINKEI